MNNFQEFDVEPKKSNHKKWAFKFLIYILILNISTFYMSFSGNYIPLAIIACGLLALVLLIVGTVLTIMSIKNKEQRNYQFYGSIIGYSIFIILRFSLTIYALKGI